MTTMLNHIALLLSEKPSSVAHEAMVAFDPSATQNNGLAEAPDRGGYTGTGGPWWIWIIVGVLVGLLLLCLGVACYRSRKTRVQQDATKDSNGLDEPLFPA